MSSVIEGVVAETLCRRRSRGWLVGGTVRDRRLGRFSPDLDIVVEDDPRQVAADLARALDAPWFALSTRHDAYRVMALHGHIDVAALQGATIEEDLGHRDFTMNAMALPVQGGELVDPFAGEEHLRAGFLVAVSERVFLDDPLRLMRAPRFCHVLGLRLDDSLERLVCSQAALAAQAAGERVVAEMVLTLAAGRTAAAADLWEGLGLLAVLLPELAPTGERRDPAGLDRFLAHPGLLGTGDALTFLDRRLSSPVDGVFPRPVALRLAMVLSSLSPEDAGAVARRLRLSVAMTALLRMTTACFSSGRCAEEALSAAARPGRPMVSFLWAAEPWEPELLLLAAGDLATKSLSLDPVRLLLGGWAVRTELGAPVPPVDGEYLMKRLAVSPGPLLGRLLREVRLAWEAGEASTSEALFEVARGLLADDEQGPVSG